MKKSINTISFFIVLMSLSIITKAQSSKIYFQQETSSSSADKDYGTLTITTIKGETKVIEYMMAYGESVKALDVQVNNGFSYKLAPAPAGYDLNYVGSSLNIVIKDGDTLTITFVNAVTNSKREPSRHIYISGYSVK